MHDLVRRPDCLDEWVSRNSKHDDVGHALSSAWNCPTIKKHRTSKIGHASVRERLQCHELYLLCKFHGRNDSAGAISPEAAKLTGKR